MKSPLETMCEIYQADQAPREYDWSMLEAAKESLREHMARIKELEAALAQPEQEPVACPNPAYTCGDYCQNPACITGRNDLANYQNGWNAALDHAAERIGEIKGFGQATQDSFAVFIKGLKK